jgi:hypothetical protein
MGDASYGLSASEFGYRLTTLHYDIAPIPPKCDALNSMRPALGGARSGNAKPLPIAGSGDPTAPSLHSPSMTS